MSGRFITVYLTLLFIASVLGFLQLAAIGTFGITPMEALFGVSFMYALYHGVWCGRPFKFPRRADMALLLLLCGSFLLSAMPVVLSGDSAAITQGIKTLAHVYYLCLFAMIMITIPIDGRQWISALRAHLVFSVVIMLFGIYQLPARAFDLPLAWLDVTNVSFQRGLKETYEVTQLALKFENFYRVTSVFTEPSGLAAYGAASITMLTVPLLLGGATIIRSRGWLLFAIVATLIALFLTFSMTGALLVSAAVILTLILYPTYAWKRLLAVAAISVVLIGVADRVTYSFTDVSVLDLFTQRITSLVTGAAAKEETGAIVGESLTQRTADYAVSADVWMESPVTGVGLGNFANSEGSKYHNVQFPSTVYGSVLAELGLIGFFIFISLLFVTLLVTLRDERRWFREYRGKDSAVDILAPLLPFRVFLLIFVAFTSNYLVTAVFWYDMVLILSGRSAVRRQFGGDQTFDLYVTRTPWRDRWMAARTIGEDHAAHH